MRTLNTNPPDRGWPAGTIFTVGHSTLPIECFVGLLRRYKIARVADIRTVPRSRHNPQFDAEALCCALKQENIDYVALTELGGLRRARKDSPNTGRRNASFRGYADYMQTEAFEEGIDRLARIGGDRRTAIMCAEALPWRCHRSLVADALAVRGIPVVEILSEAKWRPHALTPFARIAGTVVTYPAEEGQASG